MTKMVTMTRDHDVIVKRRAGIARLTKNYAAHLAQAMAASGIDDGTVVDGKETVRELDRTEMRHGAVLAATQFMASLFVARARIENDPRPGGLLSFANEAVQRSINYGQHNFMGRRILSPPGPKKQLSEIELNCGRSIFNGLRVEMSGLEPPDETVFWCDVLRGMADADPSGVVLRAAGIVALDHVNALSRALAFHRK